MARITAILGLLALLHARICESLKIGSERCPFDGMCGTNCIGTTYGGRYLLNDSLPFLESLDPASAKVLAFGIGGDASFEVGLACKYGFKIHLYDPSPSVPWHMQAIHAMVGRSTSEWHDAMPAHSKCKNCKNYWSDVAKSRVNANQLVYHSVAIADEDGDLTFYRNSNVSNETGSWSLDPTMRAEGIQSFQVPTKNLSSIMRDLKYTKLDIFKLDVEGLEISVLSQMLKIPNNSLPRLIYVDMDSMGHDNCGGTAAQCATKHKQALNIIKRLESRGYKYIKQHNADVAFWRAG